MPGALSWSQSIVRLVIGLLWAMALWQSWEAKGLYSDGAYFFFDLIREQAMSSGFGEDPRAHVIMLTQLPVLLAMKAGVVDLHWLARLYSLSLVGVPTALYSVALLRARNDPFMLAATLAAVAAIFLTSSFFIIGEYNTGYACAVVAAVWLATATGLRAADGVFLVVVAAVAERAYQHYVYLGPLLAVMTLWTMVRATVRPWFATALYGAAALLFLAAAAIAAESLLDLLSTPKERTYLRWVLADSANFRHNVQLGLVLAAMAGCAAWAVLRPQDLRRPWPYLAAGLFLILLAASPALVFIRFLVAPPYSEPQAASRTVAGATTAAFVLVLWLYASGHVAGWRVLAVLKEPRAARYLVAFAGAMVVAMLPWNIMLTVLYKRYVEVVQETIRTQSGPLDLELAIFETHPRLNHNDNGSDMLSVIMRTSPTDGVLIRIGRDPAFQVFDPATPPDLGRYRWHD